MRLWRCVPCRCDMHLGGILSEMMGAAFGRGGIDGFITRSRPTIKQRIEISTTRVTPQQYPTFRAFCTAVDREEQNRIVLTPETK